MIHSEDDRNKKEYPLGVMDFSDLVSGRYHFVDKTMAIEHFCDRHGEVYMYLRPRRFGKTLTLSMLDRYFNIRYKDDEDIFEGLMIDSCDECRKEKNIYPVITMIS